MLNIALRVKQITCLCDSDLVHGWLLGYRRWDRYYKPTDNCIHHKLENSLFMLLLTM